MKKEKKTTNEKPVTFNPLSPDEALMALLKTKPPKNVKNNKQKINDGK